MLTVFGLKAVHCIKERFGVNGLIRGKNEKLSKKKG